jgi:phenylacetate-CoA ligase
VTSFDEAQRLLGVGVRVQRRSGRHLRHLPAIAAHAAALVDGARDPLPGVVRERVEQVRRRLWATPFWVDRLRREGLSPNDFDLGDLGRFPLLKREEVGAGWTEAFALGDPELTIATSSGSTGKALRIARSGYDGLHMWAVLRFWRSWLGIDLPDRPRLVLLCTLPGGLEYSARAPQFENGALHRISTVRPRALQRLHKARSAVLSTDPAGLHWLAAQPDPPAPKLVITSAQYLAPELRARFPWPIVNYYATTETGPIAWECLVATGRFHVLHPDVHVESIDGEIAVTRLRDSVVPLLRYLPGDRGEVVDGSCACGFHGRSIAGFTGRRACLFVRPDGAEVDAWSLSWLFKDLPLVGFEMTQVGAEDFHLVVDPNVEMDPQLLATRLEMTLGRLGWPAPRVIVETASVPIAAKPEPFKRARR